MTRSSATPRWRVPPRPEPISQNDVCWRQHRPVRDAASRHARGDQRALTPVVARIQFADRTRPSRAATGSISAASPRIANVRSRSRANCRTRASATATHRHHAGEQPNTISLSLFRDPASTRSGGATRSSRSGSNPKVNQRSDEVLVYWIDYAQSSREYARLARADASGHSDPQQQKIDCFSPDRPAIPQSSGAHIALCRL